MAAHRTSASIWRPVKPVLRFPLKVLGGYMAGIGRAMNDTYSPGAGGGLVDDSSAQPRRPPSGTSRRTHRRRNR